MTTKVLRLEIAKIQTEDNSGNPIADPIGTRINKAYTDPSLAGFSLAAAYETVLPTTTNPNPAGPTHIVLYFQKP